jgi:hypothetical protein
LEAFVIAGVYNINMDQGATFERLITVKNADGSLYDFDGYVARMHIRDEYETDTFLASLTTENGGIILGGQEGTIHLYATPEITATLRGDCVYDLEIITDSGKVHRLIQGKVRVSREVTR